MKHELKGFVVDVPAVTGSTMLSLRQVTDIGLDAEVLYTKAEGIKNDIAPHLHAIVVGYEKTIRDNDGEYKHGGDKTEVSKLVLDTLEGNFAKELEYCRTKGWNGNKMPTAVYHASRSIIAALNHGGSLLELTTVSQCQKFAAEQNKAAKKAAADRLEKLTGLDSKGNPIAANDGEPVQMASFQSSPEYHAVIASAVKALDEAFKANPAHARTLAASTIEKSQNIVKGAMVALSKRTGTDG